MTYLDSSVALAYVFGERRAPPTAFWTEALISSNLLAYEVWNRVHAYGLTLSHREEAAQLLAGVQLIEMAEPVLARALQPFPVAVRTLDALHLATVDFLRTSGQRIELASYDDRLLDGARALGIPIAAL